MKICRTLRKNTSGSDVRWLKEWLFENGFYSAKITRITHDRYGSDTVNAVKAFQRKYDLTDDGIFGARSREMLENLLLSEKDRSEEIAYVTEENYPRISEANRKKINTALNSSAVTELRRKIVLEALRYATDASAAAKYRYPSSLYIRGGNLYNKDMTLNTITEKYLISYKARYSAYCTNGRLEMMKAAVRHFAENQEKISGADCSGGVIGIWRLFGVIGKNTDATANGLLGSGYSRMIAKEELIPADLVGKSGHVCIYAGGGFMVEWAGGAYGCQLTEVSDRRCWSFTKRKIVKMSACGKYCRPKIYGKEI